MRTVWFRGGLGGSLDNRWEVTQFLENRVYSNVADRGVLWCLYYFCGIYLFPFSSSNGIYLFQCTFLFPFSLLNAILFVSLSMELGGTGKNPRPSTHDLGQGLSRSLAKMVLTSKLILESKRDRLEFNHRSTWHMIFDPWPWPGPMKVMGKHGAKRTKFALETKKKTVLSSFDHGSRWKGQNQDFRPMALTTTHEGHRQKWRHLDSWWNKLKTVPLGLTIPNPHKHDDATLKHEDTVAPHCNITLQAVFTLQVRMGDGW